MPDEITYLELSEPGGAHKFYEVIVRGCEVSIRFGRIGDAGKATVTTLPSEDKAHAEAQKKIGEKLRKGYERATAGVRKKRAVTHRVPPPSTTPTPPPPQAPPRGMDPRALMQSGFAPAPLLWRIDTGARAFGLYVDGRKGTVWVGNESGVVHAVSFTAGAPQVLRSYRLPEGVKCLIADGDWRYAGCDDGRVYDLSGSSPRVAYDIAADLDIYWLDIRDGVLAISDSVGGLTVVNHEDESQWRKDSPGARGWMVRCDEIGVYHGHSKGVTMYDWESGARLWDRSTDGMVFFGWQEEADLYVATTNHKVQRLSKRGEVSAEYRCDSVVYSCAASPDGALVFAADLQGHLYGFDRDGQRRWKLATHNGAALSMQYHDGQLYFVTNTGALCAMDLSDAALQAALQGRHAAPPSHKPSAAAAATVNQAPAAVPAQALQGGQTRGVLVECFKDDGGKLRVRVVAPGHHRDWACQFPRDLRREGARYLVDEVREAARGGFYRVLGDIREVQG